MHTGKCTKLSMILDRALKKMNGLGGMMNVQHV